MGTSMPEAAVSITAAMQQNAGITIGNVVGSNILNIFIILGLTALITNVAIQRSTLFYEIPFMMFVTVVLMICGMTGGKVTFAEGIVLWALFLVYLGYLFVMSKKGENPEEEEAKNYPVWKCLLLMVAGGVLVVKGSDFAVSGATEIARYFGMSERFIGLTIVAMGTSLPEAAVSVTASIANKNALAVSNVIGSNIFNLMMVIGVCAIMTPVAVNKATLKRDFPFSVICAILLLVLGLIGPMSLGHADGVIFLILFAGFIGLMICSALKASKEGNAVASEEIEAAEEIKIMPVWKSLLFIVIGAVGIVIGGDVVVDSASNIAAKFGMSQTLIGLTIVAVGTSLPELVTSIVAARKNEVDMALGNAIGSNVFNILMVLGIASAISPISIITENIIDLCVLIAFTVCVWIFAGSKKKIGRVEGFCMVALYAVYAVYIIIR